MNLDLNININIKKLGGDVTHHLLTFLSYKDIYSYCMMMGIKYYKSIFGAHQDVNNSILYRSIGPRLIQNRLEHIFGLENTTDLLKVLREQEAIISGSFILQCLLDEDWIESDIDIYVQKREEGEEKRKEEEEKRKDKKDPNYLLNYLRQHATNVEEIKGERLLAYSDHRIFKMTEFLLPIIHNDTNSKKDKEDKKDKDKKIQVIQVSKTPFSFIQESFDFDLVRNGYMLNEDVKKEKIFLKDPLMILRKKPTPFNFTSGHLQKALDRKRKYFQAPRDFTFSSCSQYSHQSSLLLTRLQQEMYLFLNKFYASLTPAHYITFNNPQYLIVRVKKISSDYNMSGKVTTYSYRDDVDFQHLLNIGPVTKKSIIWQDSEYNKNQYKGQNLTLNNREQAEKCFEHLSYEQEIKIYREDVNYYNCYHHERQRLSKDQCCSASSYSKETFTYSPNTSLSFCYRCPLHLFSSAPFFKSNTSIINKIELTPHHLDLHNALHIPSLGLIHLLLVIEPLIPIFFEDPTKERRSKKRKAEVLEDLISF